MNSDTSKKIDSPEGNDIADDGAAQRDAIRKEKIEALKKENEAMATIDRARSVTSG